MSHDGPVPADGSSDYVAASKPAAPDEVIARKYRFTSVSRDAQQKTAEASKIMRQPQRERSQPQLRSERFRITVNEPPFGGLHNQGEIGCLVHGHSAALSKKQLEEQCIAIDLSLIHI